MNEYLLAGSEVLSREFNDLAAFYSDYHKDLHGYRPRDMALCACDYPDHASLVEAMSHLQRRVDGLGDYMKAMESTFKGREQLREDGWYIEETDPQYIAAAAESEARRKAERARMEYECSWEYHQEMASRAEEAKREKLEEDTEFWYWRKHEAV